MWAEPGASDDTAQQLVRPRASMAGDNEALLRDRGDGSTVVRQPFLIGVSGGTASGKVCLLAGFLKTCIFE